MSIPGGDDVDDDDAPVFKNAEEFSPSTQRKGVGGLGGGDSEGTGVEGGDAGVSSPYGFGDGDADGDGVLKVSIIVRASSFIDSVWQDRMANHKEGFIP